MSILTHTKQESEILLKIHREYSKDELFEFTLKELRDTQNEYRRLARENHYLKKREEDYKTRGYFSLSYYIRRNF